MTTNDDIEAKRIALTAQLTVAQGEGRVRDADAIAEKLAALPPEADPDRIAEAEAAADRRIEGAQGALSAAYYNQDAAQIREATAQLTAAKAARAKLDGNSTSGTPAPVISIEAVHAAAPATPPRDRTPNPPAARGPLAEAQGRLQVARRIGSEPAIRRALNDVRRLGGMPPDDGPDFPTAA